MSEPGYQDALRVLCRDADVDLRRVLTAACEPIPAWDPVVYLADFAHQVLFPLAAGAAGQDVAGTMAGRAFTTGRAVTSGGDGSVRVWVPVVEQTTRTGVLAVTVPEASEAVLAQAELLGVFAGLVVAAAAGQRHPVRAAAGPGHVAAGGNAVGSAAAFMDPQYSSVPLR
jgi:hypothetical protein